MDTVTSFKFPRIDTIKARCLARLIRGDSLTHRSFDSETRTYRLSSSIEQLRRDGWTITTIRVTADTKDPCGRVAKYGVYDMPAEEIKAAGQEGIEFHFKVFEWEKLKAAAKAKRAG